PDGSVDPAARPSVHSLPGVGVHPRVTLCRVVRHRRRAASQSGTKPRGPSGHRRSRPPARPFGQNHTRHPTATTDRLVRPPGATPAARVTTTKGITMFDHTAATAAVRCRYSTLALAVAFLVLRARAVVSAQEHEHHQKPERADTSATPMVHDSALGHDSSMAMPSMPDMGPMPRMTMLPRPLGIPMTRMGSGTSWLPDASPMR